MAATLMAQEHQRLKTNDSASEQAIAGAGHRSTKPVQREIVDDTKEMRDKRKLAISVTLNFILIAIIIIIVLCGVYADAFGRYKECECITDTDEFENIDINDIPDGNQYDFETTACENYRRLWENPSIPLHERNQIGRAIFQTPAKLKQATELIKSGKTYDLSRAYHRRMPLAFGRYFNTTLICGYYAQWNAASCTQQVITNAIGNIGTQFDSFGHFFPVDLDHNSSAQPTNEDFVLFNNFRGNEVFNNYLGSGDDGLNYLGVEKLPTFFTRAILIDVAGYKGVETLGKRYNTTTADVIGALEAQSLNVEDITQGDAVLLYTGWSLLIDTDPALFNDWDETPGVSEEVILDIILPRNVMIVGSDNWSVDALGLDQFGAHHILLNCGGGFIHEGLKLDEWILDARNGDAPWIAAYLFQPQPILGAVASAGKPVAFI